MIFGSFGRPCQLGPLTHSISSHTAYASAVSGAEHRRCEAHGPESTLPPSAENSVLAGCGPRGGILRLPSRVRSTRSVCHSSPTCVCESIQPGATEVEPSTSTSRRRRSVTNHGDSRCDTRRTQGYHQSTVRRELSSRNQIGPPRSVRTIRTAWSAFGSDGGGILDLPLRYGSDARTPGRGRDA